MIRPYTSADALATLQLFTRSVREVARRDYTQAQVAAWAPDSIEVVEWDERMSRLRPSLCVIDDTLAGFSDVAPDGYIDMMFVDPAFTRRGVASALLASHLSSVPVDLSTNASITARGFFERHGFSVVAERRVELRGQMFTNYRMVLRRS